MKAIWNDAVLAESADTLVVEGNHYFPRESLRGQYFRPAERTSYCPWKGTARYYTVVVDRRQNPEAAWYYPEPKTEASLIRDRIAFWKGVQVVE